MAWSYLYDEASGRLLSETEADVSPPPGVRVLQRVERGRDDEMWDEAARNFVPRPVPVIVDRLEDLANDVDLRQVWQRLTSTQRQALRDRLVRLLGRWRFREDSEPVDLT